MNGALFTAALLGLVAAWSLAFRLPFRSQGRRQRTSLWLADHLGGTPGASFALFGTVEYALLAGVTAVSLVLLVPDGRLSLLAWAGRPTPTVSAAILLAVLGAFSVTGLATSALFLVDPTVDLAREVGSLRWIESAASLGRWHLTVPIAGAMAEELLFRGVALSLAQASLSGGWAVLVTAAAFALQQGLLVETAPQLWILVSSALVIGVLGGLLCLVMGSVLPGMVLHLSFVGFFSSKKGR